MSPEPCHFQLIKLSSANYTLLKRQMQNMNTKIFVEWHQIKYSLKDYILYWTDNFYLEETVTDLHSRDTVSTTRYLHYLHCVPKGWRIKVRKCQWDTSKLHAELMRLKHHLPCFRFWEDLLAWVVHLTQAETWMEICPPCSLELSQNAICGITE